MENTYNHATATPMEFLKEIRSGRKFLDQCITMDIINDPAVDEELKRGIEQRYNEAKSLYNKGLRSLYELNDQKEREILYYYYFKAMEPVKIQKKFGIPKQTYYKKLHDAEKHFRKPE